MADYDFSSSFFILLVLSVVYLSWANYHFLLLEQLNETHHLK